MEKCEKCLYYKSKTKCGECGRLSNAMDNNPMFTPNTNYDRIKSMSVEEMAEMLIEQTEAPLTWEEYYRTPDGALYNLNMEDARKKAINHIKLWLLQEVNEDDTTRKES